MRPKVSSHSFRLAALLLALGCPSGFALAQPLLFAIDGDSSGDYLGRSISNAGDVNGDGFGDVIVGVPRADDGAPNSGAALVLSGFNGSALHRFRGTLPSEEFGLTVAGGGDADGDGRGDLLAGSWTSDLAAPDAGVLVLYSGFDGSRLRTWTGSAPGDQFGYPARFAGDVDLDGLDDIVVGCLRADSGLVDSGRAFLISGATGSPLWTVDGTESQEYLGIVDSVGDLDGDGRPEFAIGASGDGTNGQLAGRVDLVSGATASTLRTWFGDDPFDGFGSSTAGPGDVDGDQIPDIAIGVPGDDDGGSSAGSARVYSGADGSIVHRWDGDGFQDYFGGPLAAAGDVNADGYADLIVGSQQWTTSGAGYARVFDGSSGSVLYEVRGQTGMKFDLFGSAVGGGNDLDGDGHADFLVGAYLDDPNGPGSGRAFAYSGRCLGSFSIDQDPLTQKGCPGLPLVLSVAVTGQPPITFRWRKNGIPIPGASGPVLTIPSMSAKDAGVYDVVVYHCSGSRASAPATIVLGNGGWSAYGMGTPGTTCIPKLGVVGCPATGNAISMQIQFGLGGAPAMLLFSTTSWNASALGGLILVGPSIVPIPLTLGGPPGIACAGAATHSFSIPSNPSLLGATFYTQCLVLDPGGPRGVAMSTGVQMTLG